MVRTRDLGGFDEWEESPERSLARRGKLPRSSPKLRQLRAEGDLSSVDDFEEPRACSLGRGRAAAKHSIVRVRVVKLGGVCAAAALAATALPSQSPAATLSDSPTPIRDSPLAGQTAPDAEYLNPLAHTKVTSERIDQGVDYAGTGWLSSIGWARITHVQRNNTGWPGAFIEYRLVHGYRAGRYVYYAEGVRPAKGVHVGLLARPGRAIAHLIPGWSTGIEIGWGANIGTETLAHKYGQYAYPTRCGRNFSAFIASLGGPAGNAGASSNEPATQYGRP